jgi:spore maturation protein A
MNAIFFIFCALSLALCLIFAPDKALPAMLNGANKSVLLIFTLASLYCVWLGIFKLLEQAKLTNLLAKFFLKPVNKLFKCKKQSTANLISLNLVANLMGLGGVATPLGISACKQLEDENNRDSAQLLVIISATSIQLLPTSVMSLISANGGNNPDKIILPTLICTIFSTTCGVILFFLAKKIKKIRQKKIS